MDFPSFSREWNKVVQWIFWGKLDGSLRMNLRKFSLFDLFYVTYWIEFSLAVFDKSSKSVSVLMFALELNLSTFRVRWFSETKGKYFREYSEKRNSLIAQLRHFQLEKVRGCQGSCQQMAFTQSWNLMLGVIKNKQVWIVSE